MKNIIVFVNPYSRNGRIHSELVIKWLREQGFKVINDNHDCREEEVNRTLIQMKGKADLVIIGGGDGSLRSALPGLLESQIPLLYLPLGTLNNLAKTLNLPLNVEKSLEMVKNHQIREINIGSANGILFHSVIGLGLSTQVNRFVRSDLKRWLGALAFFWAGLKVIYRISPFRIHLKYDGKEHIGRSWQVTICNGRYYGSGFEIAPDADMEDGILHGQSVETEKWWYAFKFLPLLIWRKKGPPYQGLKEFKGYHIELRTKRKMRVDLDGDVKTRTPLSLNILPQKIKILTPPTI